jgi:peroxiredoxin
MNSQLASMALGDPAPGFTLPDPSGRTHSLEDFAEAEALLVAFLCNHCPFVQHILPGLVEFAKDYEPRGLRVVAVSSNDVEQHPEDGPDEMAEVARRYGFPFPYLYDELQRVALAYHAVCTPELFLFDRGRRLVYTGQFDSSRPVVKLPDHVMEAMRPGYQLPVTGEDLRAAADAVLAGRPVPGPRRPSIGCSMKWKADIEPEWAIKYG